MAIAAIIEEPIAGSPLAGDVAALAARLRRSTVAVRGREPGGGSGVIWRADGLVVTNAHVARGSHALVDLWDGRTLEAEVIDRDPQRDLAVLKVAATDLPAIAVGDSDRLRVGELVLAMGNPFGVVGALTSGIVHTIGPTEGRGRQSWVQADVRLAPGNSGGPLVDARGNAVGINSMINGGLALAVPSNAVERFLRRADRPYLGVVLQPVTVPVAGTGLPGLLLIEVSADSPAEAAGLMVGDVVIGTGGRLFNSLNDLNDALLAAEAGSTLRLELVRGGRRTTSDVVLSRKGTAPIEREVEAA